MSGDNYMKDSQFTSIVNTEMEVQHFQFSIKKLESSQHIIIPYTECLITIFQADQVWCWMEIYAHTYIHFNGNVSHKPGQLSKLARFLMVSSSTCSGTEVPLSISVDHYSTQ